MKHFINFLLKNKYLLILLGISIFIHWRWVFTLDIITDGDWWYSSKQTLDTLRVNYFTIWMPDNGLGRVLLDVGQAPTYFLYGVLSKYLNLGFEVSERVVHLYPIVFLTPIGIFTFLKRISGNSFASFTGSIIFLYNTYFLILQTGHLTLAGAFALTPFVFLFLDKIIREPSLKDSLLLSILLGLVTSYEPRLAYVILPLTIIYSVYFTLNSKSKLLIFKYLSISFIIYVFLNLFWIIGIYTAGVSSNNNLFDRSLWGSSYFTLANSFTLHHSFWTGTKLDIFGINSPPYYFWILPIAFIISIKYSFKKNKHVQLFAVIALIGIFLTKQEENPFPEAYKWLFDNIPGFKAFREASKFYILIVFGYSVCISIFISIGLRKNTIFRKFTYFLSIVLIGISLFNTLPILNESIGSTFVKRNIPKDYLILNSFLNSQPDYFRTMSYPSESRWIEYSFNHPRISASELLSDHLNNLLKSNYLYDEQDLPNQYNAIIDSKFSNQLFDVMSVKYIIVPTIDAENENNSFSDNTKEDDKEPELFDYVKFRQSYIEKLRSITYLSELNIGTKEIAIFENKDYLPYYSTFTDLYNITNTNLSKKSDFIEKMLNKKFNYTKNNLNEYSNQLEYALETNSFDTSNPIPITNNALYNDIYLKNKYTLNINRTNNSIKLKLIPVLSGMQNIPNNFKNYEEEIVISDNKILENSKINIVINNQEYIIDNNNFNYTLENKVNNISLYINNEISTFEISPKNINEIIKLSSRDLSNPLNFKLESAPKNLLIDGSFENGLWQNKVGDCNNYDKYGSVGFTSNKDFYKDGSASLELLATRHNACVSQKISVKPGELYYLSFDYYSKNGNSAGFNFGSPEMNKSDIIFERIKSDKNWKNYNRKIKIPDDINEIYITLYGFQLNDKGQEASSTLYDNVIVKNIPDTENLAYLIGLSPEKTNETVIEEVYNSNTSKILNIKSKNIPFLFRFSERYNKNWKLKANSYEIEDKNHFELNETVQGWYLDPSTYCKIKICEIDKDGYYNYKIEIDFIPQKWFNLGLGISGVTFVSVLIYLAYSTVVKRNKSKKSNPVTTMFADYIPSAEELPSVIVPEITKTKTVNKNHKMW